MKKILIINGHQKYFSAEGNLNQTSMNKMVSFFSEKKQQLFKTDKNRRRTQKFIWADIVYQTPISGLFEDVYG